MSDTNDKAPLRWEVDKAKMYEVLEVVRAFPPGAAIFISLSAIETQEGKFLTVYCTNRDYVLNATIPLLNEDAYIPDRDYFIKFYVLDTAVRLYPDFYFRFDDNKNLYVHGEFLDVQLKTLAVDSSDFPQLIYSTQTKIPFPVPKTSLISAKKLIDHGIKMVRSNVQWSGDTLAGSFITFEFEFKLPDSISDPIVFRKTDISMIALVVSQAEHPTYARSNMRFYIFSETMALSFSILDETISGKKLIEKEQTGEVIFNVDNLNKALSFTRIDPNITTVAFTSYGEDSVLMKLDSGILFVGRGSIPKAGFSMRTEELRKIISVFPDGTQLAPSRIFKDGIEFEINDRGVQHLYSIGRIDTTQRVSSSEVIDRLRPNTPAMR